MGTPIVNGQNLENYRAFREKVREDPSFAVKMIKVDGRWESLTDGPHVKVIVSAPVGNVTLEFDEPDFLGGRGIAPNPNQYCLAGAIACYGSTFTKWAGMRGVKIDSLTITGHTEIDLHTNLGLEDKPVVGDMFFDLEIESPASQETLEEIKRTADERCPAVYCLTHPLNVLTVVKKNGYGRKAPRT